MDVCMFFAITTEWEPTNRTSLSAASLINSIKLDANWKSVYEMVGKHPRNAAAALLKSGFNAHLSSEMQWNLPKRRRRRRTTNASAIRKTAHQHICILGMGLRASGVWFGVRTCRRPQNKENNNRLDPTAFHNECRQQYCDSHHHTRRTYRQQHHPYTFYFLHTYTYVHLYTRDRTQCAASRTVMV